MVHTSLNMFLIHSDLLLLHHLSNERVSHRNIPKRVRGSPFETIGNDFCLGGNLNIRNNKLFKNVCVWQCAKMSTFWNSRKLRYGKIICSCNDSKIFLNCLKYFVNKKEV